MSEVKSCNSSSSSLFSSSSELLLRNDCASKLERYAIARNPNELLKSHIRRFSNVGGATDVCASRPECTNPVNSPSAPRHNAAVKKAACRLNKMLATIITSRYSDVK